MLKITADRLIKGDIITDSDDDNEVRITRVEKINQGIHLSYEILDSDGVIGGMVMSADREVEVIRHGY